MSATVVPGNGNDKGDDATELVRYKSNVTSCTPQQRYFSVSNDQFKVIDKTQYCGIQTASMNNYYGHDEIRGVFLDKAPWNWFLFYMTLISLCAGIIMVLDESNNKQRNNLIGLICLVLFLIYLLRFLYQFFRPQVNSYTTTTRWAEWPCSWGGQYEPLTFMGNGPSLDVKSVDDIGVGVLSKMAEENVISEHWGRNEKGVSTRVILTNHRLNIRRSRLCCCNKIITQDALESWKLEEVTSVTAEQSFPLWWILATIWAILVIIVWQIAEEDVKLKADRDFQQVIMILLASVALFFFCAARMTGGVGYCRKSFVQIYFKSPIWVPCFFIGARTNIELPRGSAQGAADEIAKAIISAKDAKAGIAGNKVETIEFV